MDLYYGLFAIETAYSKTNTISPKINRKDKSSSSAAAANSWIYTEDFRKHFTQRYTLSNDMHTKHSWIYSQPLRNYLSNSTKQQIRRNLHSTKSN